MLERIRALNAAGRWAEIRTLAPALLESAQGAERIELHVYMSVACYRTAEGPADWQQALAHAHACHRLAVPGSYRYAWALHQLACLYADLGRPRMVRMYAGAFLRQAAGRSELDRFVPYVWQVLGLAAYRERHWKEAAHHLRAARMAFDNTGDQEQVARTAQMLVWAYIRLGRATEAKSALVVADSPVNKPYVVDSARVAVSWAEGRWIDVLRFGRRALDGARLAQDNVDAAEVCLLMADASRNLGAAGWQTLAYMDRAAQFAARQDCTIYSLSVLSQRAEGGDSLYVCAASRGSADLHDRGCFSPGLA